MQSKDLLRLCTVRKDGVLVTRLGNAVKFQVSRTGFLFIELQKDGKRKRFYIHRVLAEKYIPNPDNKPIVRHIDGDKLNNSIENLRWVTRGEVMKEDYAAGRRAVTCPHWHSSN